MSMPLVTGLHGNHGYLALGADRRSSQTKWILGSESKLDRQ
jgi:hypothetical protein